MNKEQFYLNKLDDQAKKIGLATSKAMQFGLDSNNLGKLPLTNQEQLIHELQNLAVLVEILNLEFDLGYSAPNTQQVKAKKEQVAKHLKIAKVLGHVT